MPKIEFFIPTYSPNFQYLSEAIQSLENQSCNSWGLTIVDGSVDESGHISSQLMKIVEESETDIRYVRNTENRTIAGNWNFCMELASKRHFVVLLHDDDYLHKDYVKKMLKLAEEQPGANIYYCGANIVNNQGASELVMADLVKSLIAPKSEIQKLQGDKGLSSLLKGCFIYCPSVMYNPADFPVLKFKDQWQMVMDLNYYVEVLFGGGTIIGLKQKYYNYRRHAQSQTSQLNRSMKRFEEEQSLYANVSEIARKRDWCLTTGVASKQSIIKLHLLYQAGLALLRIKPKQAVKLLSLV